jgi:hypothetical protein
VEERKVKDSSGNSEIRFVIATLLRIGERSQPIELTLTNRDEMTFRMLIGRAAVRGQFLVNPGASFQAKRLNPGNRSLAKCR